MRREERQPRPTERSIERQRREGRKREIVQRLIETLQIHTKTEERN